MDTNKIFEILEITETQDEGLIKEAYRRQLVSVNSEDMLMCSKVAHENFVELTAILAIPATCKSTKYAYNIIRRVFMNDVHGGKCFGYKHID